MFRTRLIVGSILAALVFGALFVDGRWGPWYPLWMLLILTGAAVAVRELLGLIPGELRPWPPLAVAGVMGALIGPWIAANFASNSSTPDWRAAVVVATVIAAFLRELWIYTGPRLAVPRVAMTVLTVLYLGVLPSYLVSLRWLPASPADANRALHALILAIFVPKCGDIGAYLTGKVFGRHRMTPLLSPKKTWEGAAGAFVFSGLAAILGASWGGRPTAWVIKASAFGIVIGGLGMLGDLAESLIKRESFQKDASDAVPGFGGVLDVIDSVVFTAPVSYWGLTWEPITPI